MKTQLLLLFTFVVLFSQCTSTQSISSADISSKRIKPKKQFVDENGKCWQLSSMPALYEDQVTEYHTYTGDASTENVDIEEQRIETKVAESKWVKKRKSRVGDDWVYCLEKTPADSVTFIILKDPSQSENYKIEKVTKRVKVKDAGYTELQEILCESKVDISLVHKIQEKLAAANYKTGKPAKKMNSFVKEGLTKYQKYNKLPVGTLNFATLENLGIDISSK